jgi:hypothetical protein
MALNKDWTRIIRLAEAQGWTVVRTKGNHIRFIPADKTQQMVHTPSTPSDHRSFKNSLAQLRKSGLQVPGKDNDG